MEEQQQHSKTSYGIDGTEPTVAEEDRSLSATHTQILLTKNSFITALKDSTLIQINE